MSDIGALVERLVAAGLSAGEAGTIIAEAFAAGAASSAFRKSSNADRQQRYRDRQAVTKRNETVTPLQAPERNETVTDRNETVTRYAAPLSIDKISKKEKRGSQIPEGFKPDDVRWTAACRVFGNDGAERELRKFTAHHRAKGTVFKNWNSGWDKWIAQSEQWQPKQAAGAGIVKPDDVDWRTILVSYQRFKNWPKGHGNDPTSPACKAPPELLREFGFQSV